MEVWWGIGMWDGQARAHGVGGNWTKHLLLHHLVAFSHQARLFLSILGNGHSDIGPALRNDAWHFSSYKQIDQWHELVVSFFW